ncbi:MAG TPA: hypothetical protein H9845_07670 [Candidatus Agathobaculum pullicola]|nr:hypothetical protein [Candidatus Agathobaculum pullicola]
MIRDVARHCGSPELLFVVYEDGTCDIEAWVTATGEASIGAALLSAATTGTG